MWIALSVIVFLILLYFWCLMGRRKQENMQKFYGWRFAHRGLHDEKRPENSMAAFHAALEAGFGIELDLHLLKDGNVGVMHDSLLERTTGRSGRMEELTTDMLSDYYLNGTDQTIPQFSEVLELFAGKAPLIVELKTYEGNIAPLCEAACKWLDSYEGLFCIESFDPRVVRWFRKHRPHVIRGQLSENWMGQKIPVPGILKWILTYHLGNFYTRPDFIAYKFEHRKTFGTHICRKWLGISGVSWTLKSKQQYDTAVSEGWIPIFEGFRPE